MIWSPILNGREEILENVLEGESDRDASDAERADEIARRKSGECCRDSDESSYHYDRALSDASHREPQRTMRRVDTCRSSHERFYQPAQEKEKERNYDREDVTRE
jgi:hypothetical protein